MLVADEVEVAVTGSGQRRTVLGAGLGTGAMWAAATISRARAAPHLMGRAQNLSRLTFMSLSFFRSVTVDLRCLRAPLQKLFLLMLRAGLKQLLCLKQLIFFV